MFGVRTPEGTYRPFYTYSILQVLLIDNILLLLAPVFDCEKYIAFMSSFISGVPDNLRVCVRECARVCAPVCSFEFE